MTDADIETFTDAFLADDAKTAMRPEFEELAIATALTYAKSGAGTKNRSVPIKAGREQAVLDVIMENAYSGESLKMSLSRLSKAAGVIGFPCLNAFFASVTYKIYPHLTEKPYGGKEKPTIGNSRGERRQGADPAGGRRAGGEDKVAAPARQVR